MKKNTLAPTKDPAFALKARLRMLDALDAAGGPLDAEGLAGAAGLPGFGPVHAHRLAARLVETGEVLVSRAGRCGRKLYRTGPR